jgi:hypothetical protein
MSQDVDKRKSGIAPRVPVIVVLHNPREKSWGILDEITPAGVFLRGLDLNSFDDWLRAVTHNEGFAGFNYLFFPMWRVERLTKDEAWGEIPSLYDQVRQRTGRTVEELLQDDSGQ